MLQRNLLHSLLKVSISCSGKWVHYAGKGEWVMNRSIDKSEPGIGKKSWDCDG
jgi:hypothetical protein